MLPSRNEKIGKKCCGLCCRVVCIARNVFKTQNPRLINKRGFKSRATYSGAHTVYLIWKSSWLSWGWSKKIKMADVKNKKNALFACFRPYIGQPDNHIGWATSLPLASIYYIDPRTNPWNFCEKILRIGGVEQLFLFFFESTILIFFFQKKSFCFTPHENQLGFHMSYCLFLQHKWFVQNLEETSFQLICTRLYLFSHNLNKLSSRIRVWIKFFLQYSTYYPSTALFSN